VNPRLKKIKCFALPLLLLGVAGNGPVWHDRATFTATAHMTTDRIGHTTGLLPDGTVLIAGTGLPGGIASTSAELYTPRVLVPAPVLLSCRRTGEGKAQSARPRHDRTVGIGIRPCHRTNPKRRDIGSAAEQACRTNLPIRPRVG
jgi:hypothetical protein